MPEFLSGLWQKRYYVRQPIRPVAPRLACITDYHYDSSAIIEDIEHISKIKTARLAYFFFDFKDTGKQDARAFLSSILVQLGKQSTSFCNILLEFYSAHQHGSQQPGDRGLMLCLEEMLKVTGEEQIYIIVDALDECPDTFGLQSSREKVFDLVEELIRSQLPNLRLCV